MKLEVLVVMLAAALGLAGCHLDLDPPPAPRTVARYDLAAGVIPMPTDAVRDEEAGHLGLPIDADMSAAEVAFREFLNQSDAWSSTFPAKVKFSGPIDRATVTPATFQLWRWGEHPEKLDWAWEAERPAGYEGPIGVSDEAGSELEIDPPRSGWDLGGRYVLLVLGGPEGVKDAAGAPVGIDKAFYFLRMRSKLDTYENNRAFPGSTRAERLATAAKLEQIRLKIAPLFDYFESEALPAAERIDRYSLAALWSFTVTTRAELAMDRPSQRLPLPFDLLIDPDTGLVDLPPAPWDDQLEADAKKQLGELRGFGVSANLMFELTRAVAPASAYPGSVQLHRLGPTPTEIPLAEVRVMAEEGEAPCQESPVDPGCKHLVVRIEAESQPLAPATEYAVVVRDSLRDADGGPVVPMLIGHFMRTETPLVTDGNNQLAAVLSDDLAARLESSRTKVSGLLDQLGREDVVTAWPFTTLEAVSEASAAIGKAEGLAIPAEPSAIAWKTLDAFNKDEAFEDLFPGIAAAPIRAVYATRLTGVARVVEGAIKTPYLLDPVTRRLRDDGGYEARDVRFVMTIPASASPTNPAPVVIFAHAVVTDRRFVLTIAGELAQKGFAAIAIDLPFHGERIACVESSLVAIPNFLSEELKDLLDYHDNLIMLPPCLSGDEASCAPTGECLDANGQPEPFNNFLTINGKPAVMDLKPASGAAFLDIDDIPYIKDHFLQALVDLGALARSLRSADWLKATGYPIRTDGFYFAGQSLGSIVGAVYVAVDPSIRRAVLNVPGADLVDLFMDSLYFRPQFDDFFLREQIAAGSFRQERLLNVARWLIDSVDPHTAAFALGNGSVTTPVLLQIDSGAPTGDIIIPNHVTRELQRVSGRPMREYASILHADLIVPLLGDGMLTDMARFLAGEIDQ